MIIVYCIVTAYTRIHSSMRGVVCFNSAAAKYSPSVGSTNMAIGFTVVRSNQTISILMYGLDEGGCDVYKRDYQSQSRAPLTQKKLYSQLIHAVDRDDRSTACIEPIQNTRSKEKYRQHEDT